MSLNRGRVAAVPGKTLLRFGSLALATLQAAGMNGTQDGTCRVEGAEYLAEKASADQICQKFKQSMFNALNDGVDRDTISVNLSIEKGGTITALLISANAGKTRTFFEVAIDVMDRALNLSDIDRLAKAAADVVNQQ